MSFPWWGKKKQEQNSDPPAGYETSMKNHEQYGQGVSIQYSQSMGYQDLNGPDGRSRSGQYTGTNSQYDSRTQSSYPSGDQPIRPNERSAQYNNYDNAFYEQDRRPIVAQSRNGQDPEGYRGDSRKPRETVIDGPVAPIDNGFAELDEYMANRPRRRRFGDTVKEVTSELQRNELDDFSNKLTKDIVTSSTLETERYKQQMRAEADRDIRKISAIQADIDNKSSRLSEAHRYEMEAMEKANEEISRQRREERAEYNKRSDFEFQEAVRKEDEEYEETLNRLREKKRRCQEETERVHEEFKEKLRQQTEAILHCMYLKKKFELEEEKLANWLAVITNSIAKAKNEFAGFEKDFGDVGYNRRSKSEKKIMVEELNSVHQVTLAAYNIVNEAWEKMRTLSEKFPDKVFIFILLKNFSMVSDKLFSILEAIDHFLRNKTSISRISNAFSDINTYDVLSTYEIRNISKTAHTEDYQYIADPKIYCRSEPIIEEIEQNETTV